MAFTGFFELEKDLAQTVREAVLDFDSFETSIRACDLQRCRGMCCHDGVYIGSEEKQTIEKELTGDFFEQRGKRWKTRTVEAEPSQLGEGFPTHFPQTRCVFLDEQHYCRLQTRAMEQGRHPWFWKPFPCWLHPLGFRKEKGMSRLTLSLPQKGRDPAEKEGYPGFASCTTCGRPEEGGKPAWQVLEPELRFLSEIGGRDLLAELAR